MAPIIPVFDGHNDTLTRVYRGGAPAESAFLHGTLAGHMDVPRAQQGGLRGGFFAIFTPPPPGSPELDQTYGVTFTAEGYIAAERSPIDPDYARAFTDANLDLAYGLASQSQGEVRIALTVADLEASIQANTLALVLQLEGAEAIHPDLSNLEAYYERGVRSIGVVWSRPNAFGYGVPFRFPDTPNIGDGLTEAGKRLVTACNDLGILLDLAHLNEVGFFEVAALSRAPLVVTHADVHAICPSTRNLTDGQLKAIGDSGGVVGINFETNNTHPKSSFEQDVPLTQITAHINYVRDLVGIDHVAFGSDFDGADMPLALGDVGGLPKLLTALRAEGYSQSDLEKVAYRNWLRVLRETWG
ncbi:MAG: dipeptidase [Chloroflexi bacterium]|nr:dipeptidase [Chloroflexota bacterium]